MKFSFVLLSFPAWLAFISACAAPRGRPWNPTDITPQTIRDWMVPGASLPKSGNPWLEYLALEDARKPGAQSSADREKRLRELLSRPMPGELRRVILLDLLSNPSYQSKQAQFIRRYGFYASGFNRVAYVTSRAVQGNMQAFSQWFVDAIFFFAWRERATPAERRVYKLLNELHEAGQSSKRDNEKLKRLRGRVEAARAEADLERARWALKRAEPEQAIFYAASAEADSASAKQKAGKIRREAESAIARRERETAASAQVGYPDRRPPVRVDPPEPVRQAFGGGTQTDVNRRTAALLLSLISESRNSDPDAALTMKHWSEGLRKSRSASRETEWLRQMVSSPRFNPAERLARAEAERRGSLARFIFLGPQSARDQTYAAASRFTQAWNTLSSIGVFYIFEIVYRAGIAAFRAPPPADEVFDAEALFLRDAPQNPAAPEVARDLSRQYKQAGRYDQARQVLREAGLMTDSDQRKLDKAEARRLLSETETRPPGDSLRTAKLQKVQKLVPGTRLATRAEKELAKKPPVPEIIKLGIDGGTLARWLADSKSGGGASPIPAGGLKDVPSEWLVEGSKLRLEGAAEGAEKVKLIHKTRNGGKEDTAEREINLAEESAATASLIRFLLREGARAKEGAERPVRQPIPFEITGGAGLEGVDLYPRLLPIESTPDELKLYEN